MEEKKQQKKKGIFSKIIPREYDFYAGLHKHADKVQEGTTVLVRWFKTKDPLLAGRVREIEHEADDIMLRISSELGRVFATPIDREDIHLLVNALDQIINYAKNTVREVEIFNIVPDDFMVKLSIFILEGSCAVCEAVRLLPTQSPEISQYIAKAVKSEHRVEKIYRRAVNKLFELEDLKEILKKREVYRHLSNTADRILDAADLLSMISVKYG